MNLKPGDIFIIKENALYPNWVGTILRYDKTSHGSTISGKILYVSQKLGLSHVLGRHASFSFNTIHKITLSPLEKIIYGV